MKIILEKQEAEEIFFNAMCNGLGYVTSGYDLELDFNDKEYQTAAAKLKAEGASPCFEDVLMQVLRDGGSITLEDIGCEGEYTKSITLADVHERVALTPTSHLMDMINENDDACTADVVLQTVFFEEVVFG
jgi:hypothetical protein